MKIVEWLEFLDMYGHYMARSNKAICYIPLVAQAQREREQRVLRFGAEERVVRQLLWGCVLQQLPEDV